MFITIACINCQTTFMKKQTLFFIAIIFINCCLHAQKSIDTLPQVYLYNINGDTTTLKELSKNKVTFIDFWFIPCGACFTEMNMLHKIYDRYKNNNNLSFITITNTDSAFVRPLIENRNTPDNETFNYFKTLSDLKKFKLPVYFIKDGIAKVFSFKKEKIGFVSHNEPRRKENDSNRKFFPDKIFGFNGYPTILIFNKYGKLIYRNTGFYVDGEKQQMKEIEKIIEESLQQD